LLEDLKNSPLALKDFYNQNPALLGPLKHLDYWLEYVEKDVFAEPRSGDNIEAKA